LDIPETVTEAPDAGPCPVTIEISVLTPTRNRAAVLVKCLRALMVESLAADQYEVVVDDGSTEAGLDLALVYE
jgi:glycosyltransferase involved in cell wall biosynthesis